MQENWLGTSIKVINLVYVNIKLIILIFTFSFQDFLKLFIMYHYLWSVLELFNQIWRQKFTAVLALKSIKEKWFNMNINIFQVKIKNYYPNLQG